MFSDFRHRFIVTIGLALFAFGSVQTMKAGELAIGRVLYSYGTSVGAASVAKPDTIFSGDVLTTKADGNALVEFTSGNRLKVMESSSVRFERGENRILIQLQSGAVVPETVGSPTLVVSTAKYRIEASQLGECRFLVRLSKEQMTTAAAMKGNLLVRTNKSNESFVLHEGNYLAIDADAPGVPPQTATASSKPKPAAGSGSHPGWRIGSLSEGESIALEVGIAAGAAGIAIPLLKSTPASPSEP